MNDRPVSRAFLVVDVENSSNRVNTEQTRLRADLYAALEEALAAAQLTGDRCAVEDRGDGVMVVADAEVLDVLDPVVEVLVDALARRNALVTPPEWMRLRIAVHHGFVHRDPHGWTGDDLTTTFRIVNSDEVKAVLVAADRAQAVVVVSDAVHRGVVRQCYRGLDPGSYRELNDGQRKAWVRVPGYATPPEPAVKSRPVSGPPLAKNITFTGNQIGSVHNADSIEHVDARAYFGVTEPRG